MSDRYELRWIYEADTEQLEVMQAWTARRGNVTAAVTVAFLLGGVWLDWRWFPTALVPLAMWGFFGYLCGTMRRELATRPKENGSDG